MYIVTITAVKVWNCSTAPNVPLPLINELFQIKTQTLILRFLNIKVNIYIFIVRYQFLRSQCTYLKRKPFNLLKGWQNRMILISGCSNKRQKTFTYYYYFILEYMLKWKPIFGAIFNFTECVFEQWDIHEFK